VAIELFAVITNGMFYPVHLLEQNGPNGHIEASTAKENGWPKSGGLRIGRIVNVDFKSKKVRSASAVQTNLVPFLRRSERAAEMRAKWGTNLR